MGYDTIYALQDREDDALVGDQELRPAAAAAMCAAGWRCSMRWRWRCGRWPSGCCGADLLALLALVPAALHLGWQVVSLDPADGANPLARFRSNRFAGALVAAACFIVGNAGG